MVASLGSVPGVAPGAPPPKQSIDNNKLHTATDYEDEAMQALMNRNMKRKHEKAGTAEDVPDDDAASSHSKGAKMKKPSAASSSSKDFSTTPVWDNTVSRSEQRTFCDGWYHYAKKNALKLGASQFQAGEEARDARQKAVKLWMVNNP